MTAHSRAIGLVLCATFVPGIANAAPSIVVLPASASAFYPTRPAHARVYEVQGVITGYGRGTRSGSLTLRRADGRVAGFYLAERVSFDGRALTCGFAPQRGERPDATLCADWPRRIVLGRTPVRADYWYARRGSERVRVVDRLYSSPSK